MNRTANRREQYRRAMHQAVRRLHATVRARVEAKRAAQPWWRRLLGF